MKTVLVFCCAVFLSLPVSNISAQSANSRMVLIFPARPAVVQSAFDAAWLRPIELISYDKDRDGNLLMWRWNSTQQKWIDLPAENLRSNLLMRERKPEVLVIGDNSEIVTRIQEATVWAESVDTLMDMNKLPVFNRLNESLQFSSREWRWLADRHGIQLQDVSVERRRYGRRKAQLPQIPPQILPRIPLEPRRGVSPRSTTISIPEPVETIEFEAVLTDQKPEPVISEEPRQRILIEAPQMIGEPEKGVTNEESKDSQQSAPETVMQEEDEDYIK